MDVLRADGHLKNDTINLIITLTVCCDYILQHSVVDDPISEAVCIIANTDKW